MIHLIYSPLLSILSIPFIALGGDRGELVIPVLAGLMCLFLFGRLLLFLRLKPAWLAMLMAGLATPLWFYSLNFWEHTLAIALAFGALVLVLRKPFTLRDCVFSGLLATAAGAIREELLIFAVAIWLMLVWHEHPRVKVAAYWLLGMGFLLVPYVIVNVLVSGSPFGSHVSGIIGYLNSKPAIPAQILNSLLNFSHFVFDPGFDGYSHLLVIVLLIYGIAARRSFNPAYEIVQIAALVVIGGLIGLFLGAQTHDSLRGVVSSSPLLVLALLPGIQRGVWVQRLRFIWIACFVITVFSIGILIPPDIVNTGREWGARYFLILFVAGLPLAFNGLLALNRRAGIFPLVYGHLAAAIALIALSFYIELIGIRQMDANNQLSVTAKAEYLALPEKQVISNIWWLPAMASDIYEAKDLFYVEPNGLRDWIALANKAGIRQFAFIDALNIPLNEPFVQSIAPPETRLRIVRIQPFRIIWRSIAFEIVPP